MNKPYSFLGYWGKISQCDRNIFNQRVQQIKTQNTTQVTHQETWGVIYLGDKLSIDNKQGVFLSAGGLLNHADGWVKISDNDLSIGRDSFGRVPLYWTQLNQTIWFSSRFQLLLPLLSHPQVNLSALSAYICFSYVPTPLTPVEGIFSIAAGTEQGWRLTQNLEKLPLKHLYQWSSFPKVIQDEASAIEQLKELLKSSFDSLLSDLKDEAVGVFLSGGLDSSIVAANLVKAGVKVCAYSLDFGLDEGSELNYAEQTANFLQIPLVKVPATPQHIKQALRATVKALDIPFGDGVTVPLYLLGKAASQETSIIFNGEHGDQLFAGWTNKPLIAASLYQQEDNFIQHYLNTFHRLYGYESRVFHPLVYEQIKSEQQANWLKDALDESFTDCFLDRLRRANLMLKGSQNIQPRATYLGFAHGLWVRSPFCHLPLAEWTFGLSGEFFLRGSTEKYILKKVAQSWLPSEIVWREKRGMGVPLTQWCLSSLWSTVGEGLNPHHLRQEGRFNPDVAMQVIRGQLGGQIKGRRIGEILWLLLIWEVWRAEVLGEKGESYPLYNPFWIPYQGWKRFSSLRERE